MRQDAEARTRVALARKLETDARLKEEREWRRTHPAPTRSELETLRAMFPNLQPKRRR
jgi:hypothetical protein